MNRIIPLAIIGFLASGCASTQKVANSRLPSPQYDDAEAAALIFESSVTPGYPLPGLDREPRQPWAFAGFEDSVTEFYAVTVGDTQSTDPCNTVYDRVSVSQKVGVRYR